MYLPSYLQVVLHDPNEAALPASGGILIPGNTVAEVEVSKHVVGVSVCVFVCMPIYCHSISLSVYLFIPLSLSLSLFLFKYKYML